MKMYYYCYIYGAEGPKIRHEKYEDAENEARRLTEKLGKRVEILKIVAVSKLKAEIEIAD